jgi:hypothetical protein
MQPGSMMRCPRFDINNKTRHHFCVRTTVNLDDDTGRLVKRYAESRSMSLGKALSELALRGLSARRPTKLINGLLVFDLPPDSPKVTTKKVRELEAELP